MIREAQRVNARILIVEDDRDIADIISRYLKKDGAVPLLAGTGEEALTLIGKEPLDLIVLDINLPSIDGFEVLAHIRSHSQVPVIIVSARQEDADMILGFGIGADDYVTKPFSPSVLVARIRAHLRKRTFSGTQMEQIIEFGEFLLDLNRQVLTRDSAIVNLSPREMDLLIFLAEHPEHPFSQEELYRQIWGNDYGDLSTVSVHIRRLRIKLGEGGSSYQHIRSRYGYGYYFSRESARG